MNTVEASKILAVLNASYTRSINEADAAALIKLWSSIFADIPYSEVGAAVVEFIKNDKKGFMPLPGQILELVENSRSARTGAMVERQFAYKLETAALREVN